MNKPKGKSGEHPAVVSFHAQLAASRSTTLPAIQEINRVMAAEVQQMRSERPPTIPGLTKAAEMPVPDDVMIGWLVDAFIAIRGLVERTGCYK